MTSQYDRIRQLTQANEVLADLEDEIDSEMSQARSNLGNAGDWIENERYYSDFLQQAIGRIIGIAIRYGHDEIATAAAEVVEPADEDTTNNPS
jgi:hypothetical protein